MDKSMDKEESLERKKFRSKDLKEGEDDVRVFFKEPHNVRGKDRLLCFVSEHTVSRPAPRHLPPARSTTPSGFASWPPACRLKDIHPVGLRDDTRASSQFANPCTVVAQPRPLNIAVLRPTPAPLAIALSIPAPFRRAPTL